MALFAEKRAITPVPMVVPRPYGQGERRK